MTAIKIIFIAVTLSYATQPWAMETCHKGDRGAEVTGAYARLDISVGVPVSGVEGQLSKAGGQHGQTDLLTSKWILTVDDRKNAPHWQFLQIPEFIFPTNHRYDILDPQDLIGLLELKSGAKVEIKGEVYACVEPACINPMAFYLTQVKEINSFTCD